MSKRNPTIPTNDVYNLGHVMNAFAQPIDGKG
jgi:hypothetical protein